jgi:formylglycine-generating enzyme required for sulfatase activity
MGYIVVMKIDFHIKLLIALLAIFGVVISIFIVYDPIKVRILAWKLESSDKSVREDAIQDLLKSGERGSRVLIEYFKTRYSEEEVEERIKIVETMCGMGDEARAAMKTMFKVRCKKEMVSIPAGEFMMGSESGSGDEMPVHKVILSAFSMDKYEFTNEKYFTYECLNGRAKDYKTWAGGNSFRENPLCPVVKVSWNDAKAYADWMRMKLPTEAQWEYACRAGSTGEYCFGDNAEILDVHTWYDSNSGNKMHPVGEKKPNKYGLYDMHGNVWEWCADWYDETYYSISPLNNPPGPESGIYRVLRGGGWFESTNNCRSAHRYRNYPQIRYNDIGFRACGSAGP